MLPRLALNTFSSYWLLPPEGWGWRCVPSYPARALLLTPPKSQSCILELQALSDPIALLGRFFQNVPHTFIQVEHVHKQQVQSGDATNYHHLHE